MMWNRAWTIIHFKSKQSEFHDSGIFSLQIVSVQFCCMYNILSFVSSDGVEEWIPFCANYIIKIWVIKSCFSPLHTRLLNINYYISSNLFVLCKGSTLHSVLKLCVYSSLLCHGLPYTYQNLSNVGNYFVQPFLASYYGTQYISFIDTQINQHRHNGHCIFKWTHVLVTLMFKAFWLICKWANCYCCTFISTCKTSSFTFLSQGNLLFTSNPTPKLPFPHGHIIINKW